MGAHDNFAALFHGLKIQRLFDMPGIVPANGAWVWSVQDVVMVFLGKGIISCVEMIFCLYAFMDYNGAFKDTVDGIFYGSTLHGCICLKRCHLSKGMNPGICTTGTIDLNLLIKDHGKYFFKFSLDCSARDIFGRGFAAPVLYLPPGKKSAVVFN